jgi:hypothetical protein
MPLVVPLVSERLLLLRFELGKVFELLGLTRDEGSAAEQVCVLGEAIGLGERARINDGLLLGAALCRGERVSVTDSRFSVLAEVRGWGQGLPSGDSQ